MYRSRGYVISCGYVNNVSTIRQYLVSRTKIKYLDNDVAVNDAVVASVEQQVLTIYPVLNIGLTPAFTVGVFVVGFLAFRFRVCLYYCIHYFIEVIVARAKRCGKTIAAGVYAVVKNSRHVGEEGWREEQRFESEGSASRSPSSSRTWICRGTSSCIFVLCRERTCRVWQNVHLRKTIRVCSVTPPTVSLIVI